MSKTCPLAEAVNKVLIGHLSDRMKASIDALLAKGEPKAKIVAACRRVAGSRSLTLQAVKAYLETK